MDTGLAQLRAGAKALHDQLAAASSPVAARLADSVLRPLDELGAVGAGAPAQAPSLAALAELATSLRAEPAASDQLIEATAALQELALADDPALLDRLQELQAGLPADIRVAHDGPYLVTNAKTLTDWLGQELPACPQLALCRCGASATKPYCDGSHARIGFSGSKSPERVPDRRDTYDGLQVTIYDNRGICQHSGMCSDRLAAAFRTAQEPFVAPSAGRMDELIRAVRDCPSGALSYAIDGAEQRKSVDHHGLREPAIEVTKDGPYRVTGAIPLSDEHGDPPARAEGASLEHYALCRCGKSQNKPFCSGMHWYVDFRDPAPDADAWPTLFEWAGGLPALTRMTRLFYEKYVPEDPILAPVFGEMSPEHPQRVAAWLGEVFGGPKIYSERYGGYPRMLSQHIGKGITEEMRSRWVTLLCAAATDAGLPNDAEFRSVFQSYIEWGSRLAVENSQQESLPPQHMPMPHWDWTTAAGPPSSRAAALAPPEQEIQPEVVVPAPGEPLGFEAHIRQLFRKRDRDSMRFAFDLWSYDDVRANAQAVLERVRAGSMPCDGAWPSAWVDLFDRWIQEGAPA
jgi:CDGSH-type Zn-finger protein